jgi:hypothetical protein
MTEAQMLQHLADLHAEMVELVNDLPDEAERGSA